MGQDRPARIIPNKNRALQAAPTSRKMFDAARKKMFLEWFAGTANLSLSARKAGVHYRTVLRHRAEKPAFAEAFDRALEQGEVRLRAWLMEAREEEARPIAFDASGPGSGDECGEDAGGDARPANLTVEQAMQLLRDNAQRRGACGPKPGRAPRRGSIDEAGEALIRKLKALGVTPRADD